MLKSVPFAAGQGSVLVYHRANERVELADPSGAVRDLLDLLSGQPVVLDMIGECLRERGHAVTDDDALQAVEGLDALALVHEVDLPPAAAEEEQERHASNLAFYELFSTLGQPARAMHGRVRRARVLLLGVGGAGSSILQALVGAGVGSVTLVDHDVVESKNLARQFCFGEGAVGRHKVAAAADWARSYCSGTTVETHATPVESVPQIEELARGCDLIVAALDSPHDVQLMVNEAAHRLRIPFVAGGMVQSTVYYWSVLPGRSACRECLERHRDDNLAGRDKVLLGDRVVPRSRVNRAVGPVVQVLAGLMGLEALRLLSGCGLPVAAATYRWISLDDAMSSGADPWSRHPSCRFCAV